MYTMVVFVYVKIEINFAADDFTCFAMFVFQGDKHSELSNCAQRHVLLVMIFALFSQDLMLTFFIFCHFCVCNFCNLKRLFIIALVFVDISFNFTSLFVCSKYA